MMCERAVEDKQETLEFVPDYYKIQMMCETAVKKYTPVIEFLPDQYKTKGMHNEAVEAYPCTLCGMINIMTVMVIIGLLRVIIMTNFLSGMMRIKNVRPRKQK